VKASSIHTSISIIKKEKKKNKMKGLGLGLKMEAMRCIKIRLRGIQTEHAKTETR
jgi:hypothetical protein